MRMPFIPRDEMFCCCPPWLCAPHHHHHDTHMSSTFTRGERGERAKWRRELKQGSSILRLPWEHGDVCADEERGRLRKDVR